MVFDLDGTLFDHPGAARRGLSTWLAGLGVGCTDDLVETWFDLEERHWAAWRQGLVSFAEQRRGRLREFLPHVGRPVGTEAELDEAFAGFLAAYERAWAGYDDVDAALTAVADLGLATAVLTNGTEVQQRAKLARLGLLDRVGPVFTSEALGVAKPDPRVFHLVCAALGLPGERVLHVGDHHEVDVLGARGAGLPAVHLDRTGAGPAEEQERITGLHQLGALLGRG